jgi:hypothetical protein
MPTNDFEPFAVTGASPNVLDQATYLAALSTWLGNGFSAGIAESIELNKVWRQGSIGSYLLGQLIVTVLGTSAVDNGDLTSLFNNLLEALRRGTVRPPHVVPFTATPTFDCATSSCFTIVLTGNVTSSTIANAILGDIICLRIQQNGAGGHTFAWPPTVAANFPSIDLSPNGVTEVIMSVTSDGSIRISSPETGGFSFLAANPGYIKFPKWLGGFTLQWAISGSWDPADNSEPAYTIPWATPFVNNCLIALVSPQIEAASAFTDNWYQVSSFSKSGVSVQRQRSGYSGDAFQQRTKALVFGIGY